MFIVLDIFRMFSVQCVTMTLIKLLVNSKCSFVINVEVAWEEPVVGNLAQDEHQLVQACCFLRKGKQCSIFWELPLHQSPRSLSCPLSSQNRETSRRPLFFLYPVLINEENSSHPVQRTQKFSEWRVTSVLAHPTSLLFKFTLIHLEQWFILPFEQSVCIPGLDFCKMKDGWSLSPESKSREFLFDLLTLLCCLRWNCVDSKTSFMGWQPVQSPTTTLCSEGPYVWFNSLLSWNSK